MTGADRAIAFQRTFSERLVEQILPAAHGRALLTPSLSRVFYANHFSADLDADVSAAELVAEAEPLLASAKLLHRKISVDSQLGARLVPEFRELGWRIEELLVMPYRGALPPAGEIPVEQVEPEELEPIWEAGIRSDPEIQEDEEVRQLVAAQHRRRVAADIRYFAARVDGRLASYCELFSDGETGQIESVMTAEEFRRRGLGTAVVTRALRESQSAGHGLTFLVADAGDWPKEMYRKLGFEVAESIWDFLRPPPGRGVAG